MLLTLKKARAPRFLLAAVMVIALAATGCGKKNDDKNAVATYKGGKITKGELDTFTKTTNFFYPQFASSGDSPEMQEYMLKQLVTLKVLSERAGGESKKEAAAETKNQMKQMEDYFNQQGKNALNNQLKELKITKDDVEAYMNRNIVVITDTNKKVTDEQAKESYDKKLKDNPLAFQVASVAHILVSLKDETQTKDLRTKEEALQRAKEVKAKLDQGGDFAALAKEYSDDPGSKDNGGKYENENLGSTMWDPAFKQAAVDQPVGKAGEPFETSFGYHIMRVDKRETQAFDAVKEQLKGELAEGLINEFMMNELPALEFKINLPTPSASASPAASATVSPEASPAASPSPAAK